MLEKLKEVAALLNAEIVFKEPTGVVWQDNSREVVLNLIGGVDILVKGVFSLPNWTHVTYCIGIASRNRFGNLKHKEGKCAPTSVLSKDLPADKIVFHLSKTLLPWLHHMLAQVVEIDKENEKKNDNITNAYVVLERIGFQTQKRQKYTTYARGDLNKNGVQIRAEISNDGGTNLELSGDIDSLKLERVLAAL